MGSEMCIRDRIKAGEVSSKDMSELEFNKLIYEIQREYGIKKCNLGKSREMQNELETINTVLRPTFQLAVRDDRAISKASPLDDVVAVKKDKIQLKDDKIASLREQVKKLEDDKKKLIVQLVDYEELKSENERLKKQLAKK
mgnify:CR=1 FL=1